MLVVLISKTGKTLVLLIMEDSIGSSMIIWLPILEGIAPTTGIVVLACLIPRVGVVQT